MKTKMLILSVLLAITGCQRVDAVKPANPTGTDKEKAMMNKTEGLGVATFAGGCFWCTESDFEKFPGVVRVVSGYTGGTVENPTYEQVCSGRTGHYEAVQVYFKPGKTTYAALVEHFWRQVDPTDPGGQFVDRGNQYRTAIFYGDDEQKRIAERSKEDLNRSARLKKPVVTAILPLQVFYEAEAYHQDYYKSCPLPYAGYRAGSGRDQALESLWGRERAKAAEETNKKDPGRAATKPDSAALRTVLTPLQFQVTQEEGTEPPFQNVYWNNKAEGIYVDVVSGEALFSSRDKYDSGTGWPSFTKPISPASVKTREDRRLFMSRTEVRSVRGDSHLGHVFSDGPAPTGQRYCINSAALRFIAREDLEKEGYGAYLPLFE